MISAPQPEEALNVLCDVASQNGSKLTLVGRDWEYRVESTGVSGEWFNAGPVGQLLQEYRVRLPGEHQALNATVALAALSRVREAGIALTDEGVRLGLDQVDWPGRLEIVDGDPVVVLDAAHNGASARKLTEGLAALFPKRTIALIFGASADKDVSGMFQALLPMTDYLIAAQAVHPRALAPEEIERFAREVGFTRPIERHAAAEDALQRARQLVGAGGVICTTGSLFIVGEMRSVLGLPAGHVAPRKAPTASRRINK